MSVNYTQIDPEKLEFVVVASLDEIQNGERLFVQIDEYDIVVFNIAGKIFAIADVCSHDDGPLGEGEFETEYEIACPRHAETTAPAPLSINPILTIKFIVPTIV